MNVNFHKKFIGVLFGIALLGCSNPTQLQAPEKIGGKELTRIISGEQAARVVNKLHGLSVAPDTSIIAEYGREKKDLLYISRYSNREEAEKILDLMVEKIAAAKNGPFFHLIQLAKYKNKVYMTLGMGAIHYIYPSDNSLLWLQSYQSLGTALPPRLLKLYPTPLNKKGER